MGLFVDAGAISARPKQGETAQAERWPPAEFQASVCLGPIKLPEPLGKMRLSMNAERRARSRKACSTCSRCRGEEFPFRQKRSIREAVGVTDSRTRIIRAWFIEEFDEGSWRRMVPRQPLMQDNRQSAPL